MRFVAFLMAAALAACSTTEAVTNTAAPSLAIVPGEPAPAKAQLFTACIRQAIDARTYDREENLIRFHCNGEPAQSFYNALATRSTRIGSEYQSGGQTIRFTERLQENTTGVDFCTLDATGAYSCTLVYNAGDFLTED